MFDICFIIIVLLLRCPATFVSPLLYFVKNFPCVITDQSLRDILFYGFWKSVNFRSYQNKSRFVARATIITIVIMYIYVYKTTLFKRDVRKSSGYFKFVLYVSISCSCGFCQSACCCRRWGMSLCNPNLLGMWHQFKWVVIRAFS